MKKRFSAILLLFSMLAVSCGSRNSTPDETTPAATDPVESTETTSNRDKSDLPDKKLDGFTLRVLHRDPGGVTTSMDTIAPDEADGDVLNDAFYNRNVRLFAKYDFDIEKLYVTDVLTAVEKSVTAGDDEYDIALPYYDRAAEKVGTGIFADLNTLGNLNLSKNNWDQNFNSATSLGGKNYFAVGDIMVSDDDVLLMMLYNSDLAADLGIENLYTAVKEDRWTYDLLRKYVKQVANDLDGDGKITKDDTVGFLWASNNCLAPHMLAVGSRSSRRTRMTCRC